MDTKRMPYFTKHILPNIFYQTYFTEHILPNMFAQCIFKISIKKYHN